MVYPIYSAFAADPRPSLNKDSKFEVLTCEKKFAVVTDLVLAVALLVVAVLFYMAGRGVPLGALSGLNSISTIGVYVAKGLLSAVAALLLVDGVRLIVDMRQHIDQMHKINQSLKDEAQKNGQVELKKTQQLNELQQLVIEHKDEQLNHQANITRLKQEAEQLKSQLHEKNVKKEIQDNLVNSKEQLQTTQNEIKKLEQTKRKLEEEYHYLQNTLIHVKAEAKNKENAHQTKMLEAAKTLEDLQKKIGELEEKKNLLTLTKKLKDLGIASPISSRHSSGASSPKLPTLQLPPKSPNSERITGDPNSKRLSQSRTKETKQEQELKVQNMQKLTEALTFTYESKSYNLETLNFEWFNSKPKEAEKAGKEIKLLERSARMIQGAASEVKKPHSEQDKISLIDSLNATCEEMKKDLNNLLKANITDLTVNDLFKTV